jgi:hypothetical protein
MKGKKNKNLRVFQMGRSPEIIRPLQFFYVFFTKRAGRLEQLDHCRKISVFFNNEQAA